MRSGTRSGRVRCFDAAVALAAAALSCGGISTTGQSARGTTTQLSSSGLGTNLLTGGQRCAPTGLEICFNATDDNCNGLFDEGCGLATGSLQLVIAWDAADADVNLEVTDPNGELAAVGRATTLGLTKDRDCPGAGDDCGGQNVEVVSIAGESLPAGRYRVTVFLGRLPRDGASVHVRIGGHLGQDRLRGQVDLTREKPRMFVELQRSNP